jgi:tRNA(fMet)-specific endonuclease VapC
MRYMLDTNACIALIKHKQIKTLNRIRRTQPGQVGISAISLAELRYGADKSANAEVNHRALDELLLVLQVASFDESASRAYGQVRAKLESRGKPIGALDTMIAAHALALNAVIVTNNTKEFKRVKDLKVEDWFGRSSPS